MAFDKPIALIKAKGTGSIFDVDNLSISAWLELTASTGAFSRLFGKQGNYNFIVKNDQLFCELWTVCGVKELLVTGSDFVVGTRALVSID